MWVKQHDVYTMEEECCAGYMYSAHVCIDTSFFARPCTYACMSTRVFFSMKEFEF